MKHCPQVEIPLSINKLSHMVGLKIYNSSIAQWTQDAALTSAYHPRLRLLFLVDVNMSEFPRGLQSEDFPKHLYDVVICRMNLTSLPAGISATWPGRMSLVFEEFPFTEFPSVLTQMSPSSISLAKSNISSLPPEVITSESLFFLVLNGNPLVDLPGNITVGSNLYWLSAHSTLLRDVPTAYADVYIDVGDTPYCTSLQASSGADTGNVDCTTRLAAHELTMYPIELEDQLNGSE